MCILKQLKHKLPATGEIFLTLRDEKFMSRPAPVRISHSAPIAGLSNFNSLFGKAFPIKTFTFVSPLTLHF